MKVCSFERAYKLFCFVFEREEVQGGQQTPLDWRKNVRGRLVWSCNIAQNWCRRGWARGSGCHVAQKMRAPPKKGWWVKKVVRVRERWRCLVSPMQFFSFFFSTSRWSSDWFGTLFRTSC